MLEEKSDTTFHWTKPNYYKFTICKRRFSSKVSMSINLMSFFFNSLGFSGKILDILPGIVSETEVSRWEPIFSNVISFKFCFWKIPKNSAQLRSFWTYKQKKNCSKKFSFRKKGQIYRNIKIKLKTTTINSECGIDTNKCNCFTCHIPAFCGIFLLAQYLQNSMKNCSISFNLSCTEPKIEIGRWTIF